MSGGVGRFISALQQSLSESSGWKRTSTTLGLEGRESALISHGSEAALLLVEGDGITPGQFRSLMEGLVKKAGSASRPPEMPEKALFVLMLFEEDFPSDLRAFTGNDRRNLSPQSFIQGGWVSLATGEANFRTNKTTLETTVLQAIMQAASDVAQGALEPAVPERGRRGRSSDGRSGGGGCLKFLFFLIVLAGGAFAYWYYYMGGAALIAPYLSPTAPSPAAPAPPAATAPAVPSKAGSPAATAKPSKAASSPAAVKPSGAPSPGVAASPATAPSPAGAPSPTAAQPPAGAASPAPAQSPAGAASPAAAPTP